MVAAISSADACVNFVPGFGHWICGVDDPFVGRKPLGTIRRLHVFTFARFTLMIA